MKRTLLACLLLSALATLPSCIAVGGTSNSPQPTTGQELIDLKTALDHGAITQPEYDQKKAEILNRKNH